MTIIQTVSFDMYEMGYRGPLLSKSLPVQTLKLQYFERYKDLINSCYYRMREELNIQPYGMHCPERYELLDNSENTFLLMRGSEIIGAVTCANNEIQNVAVSMKFQRQGYGRKLVQFAISYIQKQGLTPVKLHVTKWNENAIALYQSLGFEVTKEIKLYGMSTKDSAGNWSFEFTSAPAS